MSTDTTGTAVRHSVTVEASSARAALCLHRRHWELVAA